MDELQVVQLLKIIEEAYPGRFVTTEDTIRAWVQLIGDLDAEAALSAVLDHCRTGEFPPTVAAIRRRVAEHYSAVPSAEDAYEEAREAAARRWTPPNGPMPEFSHPLIRRSVEIVGIEVMAMTTEPSVVAAQFRRVYENLREREIVRAQQAPGALPGAAASREIDSPRVVLLADRRGRVTP